MKNILKIECIMLFSIILLLSVSCTSNGNFEINHINKNIDEMREEKNDETTKLNEGSVFSTKYDDILEKIYIDNNVKILYPQISKSDMDTIDNMINYRIKNEALSVLGEYECDMQDVFLDIRYEIAVMNDKNISIIFKGDGCVTGANHNNKHFYTLNLDLESSKKIYLNEFVDTSRLFDFIIKKNYVFTMYNDFESIDIYYVNDFIQYEQITNCDCNDSEMYSYFTDDFIGISIPVPYAIGGHKEIEIPLGDITDVVTGQNTR